MTAFLGCPFGSTFPIQALPGRIPSRAIADTNRDAATMQMDMFYAAIVSNCRRKVENVTHDEKTNDGDRGHDDLSLISKRSLIDENERLRSS